MLRFSVIVIMVLMHSVVLAQYRAVYIPEDKLDKIQIDGDTTDWDWVSSDYFVNTKYMYDSQGYNQIDADDWKCKIIVGWNDISNRIYFLAIVKDDISNTDRKPEDYRFWLDDGVEIVFKQNEFGKKYSIHYWFTPGNSLTEFGIYRGPSWLLDTKEYLKWGGKEYRAKDGSVITVYEMSTVLWDYLSKEDLHSSTEKQLSKSGKAMILFGFNDVDKIGDRREAKWVPYSQSKMTNGGLPLSEFIFEYPLEEKTTWPLIDNLLAPE